MENLMRGRARSRPVPRGRGGRPQLVLATALAGILAGGLFWLAGLRSEAGWAWAATTLVALLPLAWSIATEVFKGGIGVDVIALIAMTGAIALGQELAGAVIAVMLAGGETLERFAEGRARDELSSLVGRAPSTVNRYEDGVLVNPPLEAVRRGDRLLVKPGEVVPVDGVVAHGPAVLDESALTGESRPVERLAGDPVRSGVVNTGPPFDMRAAAAADSSTYARIVRLVQEAQSSKAPFVRMADRYSVYFLPLSLAFAAAAWAISGDPVRALAVMVVATPCPLILAAPVAIVAGISRAAARGVIIKNGGALEALAGVETAIFDKTGTLTAGRPRVRSVFAFGGHSQDEVLRLAASLDQLSPHVFAAPIVEAARGAAMELMFPEDVEEVPGAGIRGRVGASQVAIGRVSWLAGGSPPPPHVDEVRRRAEEDGTSAVFVAIGGHFAGALALEDPLREDAPAVVEQLRATGIARVVVLTGDREQVAVRVAEVVGADQVLSERSPEDKVATVREESARRPAAMIGDGINDAPALAAAQIGVAMGARGATAASEAAGVVIVVDQLSRVAEALATARRTRRIALQSVIAGMALSGAAMAVAAAGFLPPVAGAVFQEAIDVAVILNALRALGAGRASVPGRLHRLEDARALGDGGVDGGLTGDGGDRRHLGA